jgi:hypothetical protein
MRAGRIIGLVVFFLLISTAYAADWYCDPNNGSMANDGTSPTDQGGGVGPWGTLYDVVSDNKIESQEPVSTPYDIGEALQTKNSGADVQAGDTIHLMNGYHGEVVLTQYYNSSTITVRNYAGHTPSLGQLTLNGGENWVFDGLTVAASARSGWDLDTTCTDTSTLIWIYDNYNTNATDNITIQNCSVHTSLGDDYLNWTQNNWRNNLCSGISIAAGVTITGNTVKNVKYGIRAPSGNSDADNVSITHNLIENFSGDSLQLYIADVDNVTISDNTIKNSTKSDASDHCDFLQNNPTGEDHSNYLITRNKFIDWDYADNDWTDASQSKPSFFVTLQALNLGRITDVTITNNIVVTGHMNGGGCHHCFGNVYIQNNTYFDPETWDGGVNTGNQPTLQADPDGVDGGAYYVVTNNVAPHFGGYSYIDVNHDNIDMTDGSSGANSPTNCFESITSTSWDFTPAENGPLHNTGSASDSPPTVDHNNSPRPVGAYDVGAIEYGAVTGAGDPTVTITSPTSSPIYSTGSSTINLSGTASDNGTVSSVTWSCPTCTPTSGSATGTAAWSISGLALATGDNVITVTATDDESNTGSDVLNANYSASNNNDSGNGGGSGCYIDTLRRSSQN